MVAGVGGEEEEEGMVGGGKGDGADAQVGSPGQLLE